MKKGLFTWGTMAAIVLSSLVACSKKTAPGVKAPVAKTTPAPVVDNRKFVELADFSYAMSIELQKYNYAKVDKVKEVFGGKFYVVQEDGKYFLEGSRLPVVNQVLPALSSRAIRFEMVLDKPEYNKAISADIVHQGVVIGEMQLFSKNPWNPGSNAPASIKNLCGKPSNYCAIQYASKDGLLNLNLFAHGPIETAFAKICKVDPNLGFGRGTKQELSLCDDIVATAQILENHAALVDHIYPIVVDDANPEPWKREIVERWMQEIKRDRTTILEIKKDVGTWMNSNKAFSLADIEKRRVLLGHIRYECINDSGKFAKQYAYDLIVKPFVANKVEQAKALPGQVAKSLDQSFTDLKTWINTKLNPPKKSVSALNGREKLDLPK